MATVTITREEAERGLLPPVCALTGEPTDDVKEKSFLWQPGWIIVFLPILLVFLILSVVMRKSMTVRLPLVRRKHLHWAWRTTLVALLILASAGAFVVGGAIVSDYERGKVGGWLMLGGVIGFVLSIVLLAVLTMLAIHPKRITDGDITLGGVHQNFVDALEQEREEDEEKYQRDKERRRDARARPDRERDEWPVPRASRASPSSRPEDDPTENS